jgi:aspartate beta-hydroxylase
LVEDLETNFDAIREELLALPARLFHSESERIDRTGEWDVAFLYERGRRHDEVLAACPVTARAIESPATVRTMAGLIYVSRMRPGTHIATHRGPTNLRLRCHLGLVVPAGDCAIRVGDQTRRWETGRCIIFDDHFEHEAWNHTDQDRIVLIVDVWHPGLSELEVQRIEGLQAYAAFHARRLNRYWSTNAAARAAAPEGTATARG